MSRGVMSGGISRRMVVAVALFSWFVVDNNTLGDRTDTPLAGASRDVEILALEVGFDGVYKTGLWTPLRVRLRAGTEPASIRPRLTLHDGDGVPTEYPIPGDSLITLKPREERTVEAYVRFGRRQGRVEVACLDGDRTLARRTFEASTSKGQGHFPLAIRSTRRLIVVVASEPIGMDTAITRLHQFAERRAASVRINQWKDLPRAWQAYEGVDTVVLCAGNLDILAGLTNDDPRLAALETWVRMGGELVFGVGRSAETVLAEDAPLVGLAPGRFERMIPLTQTASIETFCDTSTSLRDALGRTQVMQVPKLVDVEGRVIVSERGDLPLVARRAHGLGRIVFLAMDLDASPLSDWPGRSLLIQRLLDETVSSLEEGSRLERPSAYRGYDDVAGQLRAALEHHDGVRIIPFWFIGLLMVLFCAAIGPGDYFLLRKVVGRMQWTWVTFPAMVAVVCVGAYFLATWAKGSQTRVNQATLIDVDTRSRQLRATTWANIFSPSMERYDLRFELTLPHEPAERGGLLAGWFGLPGSGLGGMDPVVADVDAWKTRYRFDPDLESLQGVPIAVWSTKNVTARWNGRTDTFPEANLVEDRGGMMTGLLHNTLEVALDNALLVHRTWVFELGRIEPDASVDISRNMSPRDLNAVLTGRKLLFDQVDDRYRQESTPYDQASVDLALVLRAMCFHEKAGGRDYTHLDHRHQQFVDASRLLDTDRAVLWATVDDDAPTARLLRDDKPLTGPRDRRATVYRFVFPVKTIKPTS